MIKLPSIKTLTIQSVATLKRFPLTVISSILLSGSLIYLTHLGWDLKENYQFFWGKLSMCSALGLSLFTGSSLLSESTQYSRKGKILIQLLFLALIFLYYFSIKRYEDFNLNTFTRYTLYIIAAHMFVAFAPYIGANKLNGFWQFNRIIFIRFLLSMLYTCVLYLGIALALWLIDDLLHIEVKYTKYLYVWYFLSGVLNTFIFLSGIPENVAELENNMSYPKGLKAFTQFVLLPLVTVYLLILYIYFGKIIIHWNLPKGYVSYLVISFSIMGILSLLLIYPIRNTEGNTWIKIFSRWFYVALYPLIILLGISIFHRITDYGITEHRYFILVLALWLIFIAAYFLLGKKENIKLIPITLFVLACITSLGPWGAFSVARNSQKNRLEKILTTEGILVNGKAVKIHKDIDDSTRENIRSIVRYMADVNALDVLQPWFNINLDSIKPDRWGYSDKMDTIYEAMGISSEYYHSGSGGSFELQIDNYPRNAFSIKGFDYYSDFFYRHYEQDPAKLDTAAYTEYFMTGTDSVAVTPFHIPCMYALKKHGKTIGILELTDFIKTIRKQSDTSNYDIKVPANKFIYEVIGSDSTIYHFRFNSIEASTFNKHYVLENIDAVVLSKHQ